MKVFKRTVSFKDKRGIIQDIFEKILVDSCTYITQKKGAVRANHYHKKTVQYTYVLKGKFRYFAQNGLRGRVESSILKSGDFVVSPKGHPHAFVALENSVMLAFARGPRAGKEYERDTYRLEVPLQELAKRQTHAKK